MNRTIATALTLTTALAFAALWVANGASHRPLIDQTTIAPATGTGGPGEADGKIELASVASGDPLARAVPATAQGGSSEVLGGARLDAVAAESTTVSTKGPTRGVFELRVRDRRGCPMSQSEWLLVSRPVLETMASPAVRQRTARSARHRATTDELGLARFEDVPVGEWGVVPHFDGGTAPLYPVHPGEMSVEVLGGETTRGALEVQRMAVLHGFVHDADGRSEVAWLRATAYSLEEGHRLAVIDAITAEDGTFRVFVPVGEVRLETKPLTADGVLGALVVPSARWLEVFAGDSQYVEFTYGGGRSSVTGRVVDQHGLPWSGLHATLFAASTRSAHSTTGYGTRVGACLVGERGTFSFGGLTRGEYTVSFEHPGSDLPARGGIAEYPVVATFVANGAGEVQVGTSLVYRWENVRVEGFVSRTAGGPTRGLQLAVEVPSWQRAIVAEACAPARRRVRIDADGWFTFDYSAHVPGELVYVLDGESGERRTVVPFDVGEPREQALTLTYP